MLSLKPITLSTTSRNVSIDAKESIKTTSECLQNDTTFILKTEIIYLYKKMQYDKIFKLRNARKKFIISYAFFNI